MLTAQGSQGDAAAVRIPQVKYVKHQSLHRARDSTGQGFVEFVGFVKFVGFVEFGEFGGRMLVTASCALGCANSCARPV